MRYYSTEVQNGSMENLLQNVASSTQIFELMYGECQDLVTS